MRETLTCQWCETRFARPATGPKPMYCNPSCRRHSWTARQQRARTHLTALVAALAADDYQPRTLGAALTVERAGAYLEGASR